MTERRWIGLYAAALLVAATLCIAWTHVSARTIEVSAIHSEYWPEYRFDGFSEPEGSRRWSNTAEPRLRFDRPLPRRFTLRLTGQTEAASGLDVEVRVPGGESRRFRLTTTESTQDVELDNPWFASAIVWTLPDGQERAATAGAEPHDIRKDEPRALALTRIEVRP